jgi:hypothetical protein
VGIELNGLGGVCRWQGDVSRRDRALIAWGGVFAQALVFIGTQVAMRLTGVPVELGPRDIVQTFTVTNVVLILINLIPIPPLDGAEAWKVLRFLRRDRRPIATALAVHIQSKRLEAIPDAPLAPELDDALKELAERSRRSR